MGTSSKIVGADAIFLKKPPAYFGGCYHFTSRSRRRCQDSHFNCGAMTKSTLYALNWVRTCQLVPEELEISETEKTLLSKRFQKE